jgi:RNA recognition motif-containing protein
MAKGDVSDVAGVNQFNSLHPRKLFVSSLPKIYTESEVDIRRAELERAFRKYGGDLGVVQVVASINTSYAFLEFETERLCDMALQEMATDYHLNHARRSRREALQEERAEAQKAGLPGKTREAGGWD